MSQRNKPTQNKRRRGITFLWIVGLALLVALLIYFEQTALLYVVSTLGVTVLLVIVAVTDLGDGEASSAELDQPARAGVKGAK